MFGQGFFKNLLSLLSTTSKKRKKRKGLGEENLLNLK